MKTSIGEITRLVKDGYLDEGVALMALWHLQDGRPVPAFQKFMIRHAMRLRDEGSEPSFAESVRDISEMGLDSMARAQIAGTEIARIQKAEGLSYRDAAERVWRSLQ